MQADLGQVRNWIELIHPTGENGYTNGLIHICSMVNGPHKNWVGRTFSEVQDAVDYIARLDKDLGIYMRTTTLASVPKDQERGGDELSLMLPGFAADMDIAGPGHKPVKQGELPPDEDTCRQIVAATGLPEPTLWVHSGGGVYPWWIFDQPVDLTEPGKMEWAQTLSTRLHETISWHAKALGWFYSTATKDMSRVLRIPGTVNRKVADDQKMCQVIQPAAYNFIHPDALEIAIDQAWRNAPAPKMPEAPRPAPVVRTEDSPLRPGDDFNDRAHWADILTPHGWTYMYHRGSTWYWRRPGKDSGEHSATTGRKGVGSEDRLYVFSDATIFEPNVPYNKFAAYAMLNHGGNGATHFASATRDLRGQGFGGELPQLNRAVDAVSLVRPAPVATPVGQQAVDHQEPEQAALVVEANQTLPTLDHDGLPSFTTKVYTTQRWDEMGIVSMYSQTFCKGLKYVGGLDEWMVWNGQRWVRDDMNRHRLASRKLLTGLLDYSHEQDKQGHEHGKEMVKAAQRLATMNKVAQLPNIAKSDSCISADVKHFDQHPNLVTVDNGTLDITTGVLGDFDPELMLTKKIKAVYNPDADPAVLDKFLTTTQPDPEVLAYMNRLAGAMFLGRADERVMPLIWGESGSGKSAFLEMLYGVMGDFASVADESTLKPQPDNYQGPSEKLHSLMGTRFVKMSEISQGASLNEALVKSITGADTQKTRPLYGHPVEWRVEYMVWMATNHLPRISSNDNAIWKRLKPIRFPNTFVNEDGSVRNAGDRDMGKQLATKHASAVLNWLLKGVQEYLKHGLAEPEQIGSWLGEYRDEVDTTRQFLAEAQENGQIKVEQGQSVSARDLYKVYMAWAVDAQIRYTLSINNFRLRLLANGYEQVRVSAGMAWKGIGIVGFIGQAQTPSQGNQWMGRMRN